MEKTLNKKVLLFGALIVSIICITIISLSPVLANMKNQEAAVAKSTEQKTRDISGRRIISTLITEDFSSSKKELSAQTRQMIFIDGKSYEVVTENINTEITGGIYDVKGTLDIRTNKVYLTSANFLGTLYDGVKEETLDKKLTTSTLGKAKPRKVAVFLFDYQDTATQPFYPSTIDNMMFGDGKFARYFNEVSYGRQSITGDVFGWYTIPTSATGGACQAMPENLGSFIGNGEEIDLNSYGHVVFITLCNGNISLGSSFLEPTPMVINGTTYNKVLTWVNVSASVWNTLNPGSSESIAGTHQMTNLEAILTHEFGHAMGLHHADAISCEGNLPTDNCEGVGLGNYYDIMSYNNIASHLNVWSKSKLGWFSGNELRTITQSGIYSISDIGSPPNAGQLQIPKAYKIKPVTNSNKTPIWIEFRSGFGFDAGLSTGAFGGISGDGPPHNIAENKQGIFVYKEGFTSNTYGAINPKNSKLMYLRNAPNLGTQSNPYQVSLNPGQTYSEPRYGLTIQTLPTTNPQYRRFQVNLNPNLECQRLAPQLSLGITNNQPASAGSAKTIFVYTKNLDYLSCPNSNFDMSIDYSDLTPNGSGGGIPALLTNLSPDDERHITRGIWIPLGTAPGTYTVTVTMTNLASSLSETKIIPITVQ